jgi:hypothetical protein
MESATKLAAARFMGATPICMGRIRPVVSAFLNSTSVKEFTGEFNAV